MQLRRPATSFSSNVLNPSLYSKLHQFGKVKIEHKGDKFDANVVTIDGKARLNFSHNRKGEYYRVCCPFCGDSRYRLYVSYMFGKQDSTGRTMTFLAHCFNEDCLSEEQTRHDFVFQLDALGGEGLAQAQVREGTMGEGYVPIWPGDCTPLDQLPMSHPANAYLRDVRGFDPYKLARVYDLRYCSFSRYKLAENRIIIPVYFNGKFVGWQARYIGELNWKSKTDDYGFMTPPKYFTLPGFPKSNFLFNLDRSRNFGCGVVMEGPTDVFAFGDCGICTLGSSLNERQIKLLTDAYSKPARPIVLMFDPEAYEEQHVQNLLCDPGLLSHPGGFAVVKLPKGTDPGSTARSVLRAYVREEARKQNIRINYEKCK